MATILLSILVISIAYADLVHNAHAKAITDSSTEKGLTIINQVAGFDLTKYKAIPILEVNSSPPSALPTENIRYTLKSDSNRVEILETFINGHLKMIDVLENSDSTNKPASPNAFVGMAKAFLLNYQAYSSNSFYGQLASMLTQPRTQQQPSGT
jgi:hypothetical protein